MATVQGLITTTNPYLPDKIPPVLTPKDVEALGIARERTVRRWCECGTIKAAKVGRMWCISSFALLQQLGLVAE